MTEQAKEKFGLSIQPNPAKTVATIEVTSNISCRAKLIFFDPAGHQKLKVPFTQKLIPGKNLIHVNIAPLKPGSYTVGLIADNMKTSIAFEVSR